MTGSENPKTISGGEPAGGPPRGMRLVAIVVLAAACGWSVARYFRVVAKAVSAPTAQREFIEIERNIRLALAPIPADGRVGFYGGGPVHHHDRTNGITQLYILAQYAAPPRIVVGDTTPRFILVMVANDALLKQYADQNRLTLITHPAPGVALAERREP